MVNFPGHVLFFVPLVQMSTTEPILWFICPSLDAILGDQGINPRLRILDLAVIICLLPLLFTFALSRITIGQWDSETLSYLPETDSIFFGSMLLPTIVKVVSKLMEWLISQVRSRSPLSDATMLRILSVVVALSPWLVRFVMNGMTMEAFLEIVYLLLMMANMVFVFVVFFYLATISSSIPGKAEREKLCDLMLIEE